MIALWMIYSIVMASLLALVAVLLERVAHASGKPARNLWIAAMASSIVATFTVAVSKPSQPANLSTLPAQNPALTDYSPPSPQISVNHSASSSESVLKQFVAAPGTYRASGSDTYVQPEPAIGSREPSAFDLLASWVSSERQFTSFDRMLLLSWGTMSAAALALVGVSALRLSRRKRGWSEATCDGTQLLVTDGVGPAVVGIVKSRIAVPTWLFELDAARRALVIEHERQHLLARDPLAMMGGLLAIVTLPWNPVIWFMHRRLRRSTEMDCDTRVLRQHPNPREYATLLVDIGARSRGRVLASPALADSPSDLERRVNQILTRARSVSKAGASVRVFICAALILVACATPRPRLSVADVPPSDNSSVSLQTPLVNDAMVSQASSVAPTATSPGKQNYSAPLALVSQQVAAANSTIQSTAAAAVSAGANAPQGRQAVAPTGSPLEALAAKVAGLQTVSRVPQQREIRGRVIEDSTNLPIVDASVALLDDSSRTVATAVTLADGAFSFSVQSEGTFHRLKLTKPGFMDVTTTPFANTPGAVLDLKVAMVKRGSARVAMGGIVAINAFTIMGGRGAGALTGSNVVSPSAYQPGAAARALYAGAVTPPPGAAVVARDSRGAVAGVITDSAGAPLARVSVSLDGTSIATVTGTNGRFTFPDVPVGLFTITARRVGFAAASVPDIRVAAGTTIELALSLSATALRISSINQTRRAAPAVMVTAPTPPGVPVHSNVASLPVYSNVTSLYATGAALRGTLTLSNPAVTLSVDSLVQLVAARYPALFADSAASSGDSVLIVFAFDSTGVVTHTRMLDHLMPRMLSDGVVIGLSNPQRPDTDRGRVFVLQEVFPDLRGRTVRATGHVKGPVTPRGMATKRITLLFAVMGR